MTRTSTKVSMTLAFIMSLKVVYNVSTHLIYKTTILDNARMVYKIIFAVSIPVSVISVACVMLFITVPVMMIIEKHAMSIKGFRDIW
jgi:hypothetical protein